MTIKSNVLYNKQSLVSAPLTPLAYSVAVIEVMLERLSLFVLGPNALEMLEIVPLAFF